MCSLYYIPKYIAPGPPRHFIMRPLSNTSVQLSWKPPQNDFVTGYLLIQESKGDTISLTTLTAETDTHTVNVMPYSAYNLSLYARVNITGVPIISVLETFSML